MKAITTESKTEIVCSAEDLQASNSVADSLMNMLRRIFGQNSPEDSADSEEEIDNVL